MLVSKHELVDKIYAKKGRCINKDIAEVFGKATNIVASKGKNADFYTIRDVDYVELCEKYPEYFSLPEDFFYYTIPIVLMNYYIRGVAYYDNKFISPRVRKGAVNYMYSIRDKLLEVLQEDFGDEEYYLPYYYDKDGVFRLYEEEPKDLVELTEEEKEILRKPILKGKKALLKKESYLSMGGNMDDFAKYSLFNIKCNMFYYKISVEMLGKYLGTSRYMIYEFFKMNPYDYSMIRFKEKLDVLFKTFIIVI